jgi:hypothetical protein
MLFSSSVESEIVAGKKVWGQAEEENHLERFKIFIGSSKLLPQFPVQNTYAYDALLDIENEKTVNTEMTAKFGN